MKCIVNVNGGGVKRTQVRQRRTFLLWRPLSPSTVMARAAIPAAWRYFECRRFLAVHDLTDMKRNLERLQGGLIQESDTACHLLLDTLK